MSETLAIDRPRLGLLNLMSSPVFVKTEHQWRDGFRGLADVVPVRFDEDPRHHNGSSQCLQGYAPISEVADGLDGLIVTGANLERQPDGSPFPFTDIRYIGQLRDVVDWAESQTRLTVYSCLASHIALDHLFGIKRDILPQKVFGVFCHEAVDAPLTRGLEWPLQSPHSRWGNVPAKLLRDAGVEVLAEGFEPGWLLAERQRSTGTTVFLQGHPEYERDDLAAEYRRDRVHGQAVPHKYYPQDDPSRVPAYAWHRTTTQLFRNLTACITANSTRPVPPSDLVRKATA